MSRLGINLDNDNLEWNYVRIATELMCAYYDGMISQLYDMGNCYTTGARFTFQNEFTIGYNGMKALYKLFNVEQMVHEVQDISVQPLSSNSMIVVITGTVHVDRPFIPYPYIETLIFTRENRSANFCISSSVKKIFT
jgi:hypothetical protein